MFIDFANKSRVDTGYRLLGRCVRHAFDSRVSPMDQCKAQLFLDEDGDIGIQLASQIPASMKSNVYNTEIAATSSKILPICLL